MPTYSSPDVTYEIALDQVNTIAALAGPTFTYEPAGLGLEITITAVYLINNIVDSSSTVTDWISVVREEDKSLTLTVDTESALAPAGLAAADTVGIMLQFEYYENSVLVQQTAELTLLVEGEAFVEVEAVVVEVEEDIVEVVETLTEVDLQYTITEPLDDIDECQTEQATDNEFI